MKVYTAFLYREGVYHTTHKYLGDQSPETISKIVDEIMDYFKEYNPQQIPHLFTRRELFGPKLNVPVLMVDPIDGEFSRDYRAKFLTDLRTVLDKYRPDDYNKYRPHITLPKDSDLQTVGLTPVALALMHKTQILVEWPLA